MFTIRQTKTKFMYAGIDYCKNLVWADVKTESALFVIFPTRAEAEEIQKTILVLESGPTKVCECFITEG